MESSAHDNIPAAIRASMKARFGDAEREWPELTRTIMSEYRERWDKAALSRDPDAVGVLLRSLWDRLIMHPDDAVTRLGLAQVGAECVVEMHIEGRLRGISLPDEFESLGGIFFEIRAGQRVSYEITSSGGERRKVIFEGGERTMTLPGGDPVPSN